MYNLKKNMSQVKVIDKMEQNSHTCKHPNHINISEAYGAPVASGLEYSRLPSKWRAGLPLGVS